MLIRKATLDDCKQYFDWVNDPQVRKQSFNTSTIEWEAHQNWFSNKLHSHNSHLFVAEIDSKPLGQVRFDLIDSCYVIDYSIDTNYRGKGYGLIMVERSIRKLASEVSKSFKLKAEVKDTNIPSLRVFEKLGMNIIDDSNGIVNYETEIT